MFMLSFQLLLYVFFNSFCVFLSFFCVKRFVTLMKRRYISGNVICYMETFKVRTIHQLQNYNFFKANIWNAQY